MNNKRQYSRASGFYTQCTDHCSFLIFNVSKIMKEKFLYLIIGVLTGAVAVCMTGWGYPEETELDLQQHHDIIQREIASMQNNIRSINNRLKDIQSTLTSMSGQQKSTQSTIYDIKSAVSYNGSKLSDISSEVRSLRNKL